MKNIFVIILRYIVSNDVVDKYRHKHMEFLDAHYDAGRFIASGRQNPAYGGVILALGSNRKEIEVVIEDDPFKKSGVAEYQIFEFAPSKYSKTFESIAL